MDRAKLHILHLDDDPIDAEIINHHVDSQSFRLTWVDNQEDFKNILAQEKVDLVISDYNMPGFSAMEALKVVRLIDKFMPFLVISGAINDERAAELIKAGADDYVLKDNLPRIQTTIENVMVKKKDKEKIHELESLYETLISTTNAGFVRWNTKLECIFANKRCSQIFDMSMDCVMSQKWKDNILDTGLTSFDSFLNNATKNKQSGSFEIQYATDLKKPRQWLNVHIQPELNPNENLIGVTGTIFDITSFKETKYKASYDELTGLANRYLFHEFFERALAKARRKISPFALILFDIDYFKQINDTYGHRVGDDILQAVAKRLTQNFRKEDLISRIGGDEFAIIIEDTTVITRLDSILNKLHESIAMPFHIHNLHLILTLSIGVSIYSKANDVNKDKLIEQADGALYQAKKTGRNRTCFYPHETKS